MILRRTFLLTLLIATFLAAGCARRTPWSTPMAARTLRGMDVEALRFPALGVVEIRGHTDDFIFSKGTGVLIDSGRIITAAHVLENVPESNIEIVFGGRGDRPEEPVVQREGLSIRRVSGMDVALIIGVRVPTWATPRALGEDSPVEGRHLVAVGLENPATIRLIESELLRRDDRDPNSFYIAGRAYPGDSGGPVFDENGLLVGIMTESGTEIRRTHTTHLAKDASITVIERRQHAITKVTDITQLQFDDERGEIPEG